MKTMTLNTFEEALIRTIAAGYGGAEYRNRVTGEVAIGMSETWIGRALRDAGWKNVGPESALVDLAESLGLTVVRVTEFRRGFGGDATYERNDGGWDEVASRYRSKSGLRKLKRWSTIVLVRPNDGARRRGEIG